MPLTRISCPGFAILMDGHSRYGLVYDTELKTGFMPIGGALTATSEGTIRLMSDFGVRADGFDPGGRDTLRFVAPSENVTKIANWFSQRKERTTSLRDVLATSLVTETRTLTLEDVATAREVFSGFSQAEGETFREVKATNTKYFIECYAVFFPQEVIQKLLQRSASPNSLFRFATADEIERGWIRVGRKRVTINPISRSLFNPIMPKRTPGKRS